MDGNCFWGILKDQYLVPFCSTFFLQICYSLKIAWILETMPMKIRHMLLAITESLSFLGPKIWDILPDTYKDMLDSNSL